MLPVLKFIEKGTPVVADLLFLASRPFCSGYFTLPLWNKGLRGVILSFELLEKAPMKRHMSCFSEKGGNPWQRDV
jgi:hypothetical protein